MDRQALFVRLAEQAVQRTRTAGICGPDVHKVEIFDSTAGFRIQCLRRFVIQVMAQVRTHKHQAVRIPKQMNHFGNLLRSRRAHNQRNNAKVLQGHLQERQLDLQAMLTKMRPLQQLHLRERADAINRLGVHRHGTKWRPECFETTVSEPFERKVVRRTEQNDAADFLSGFSEQAEGGAGDGPGIGIARMRNDECPGCPQRLINRRCRHVVTNLLPELVGILRIKHSGDRRWPGIAHNHQLKFIYKCTHWQVG